MNYVSTRNKTEPTGFGTALCQGLADDGGLYVPEAIPLLKDVFFGQISQQSGHDIAVKVLKPFLSDEMAAATVNEIAREAFNFKVPLVHLHDDIYILELFHGPTLAFKDFGARFMSRAFSALRQEDDRDVTILVATSGDTGSAVAHGFYNVEGINVCLLYPSGKVSILQEQQLTTAGGNVTALEIEGSFDDCQEIVKKAFSDRHLNEIVALSSANSINIGRLLPQMVYYGMGYAQLRKKSKKKPVFCVPSGNFGNITAGLMLHQMGMPVERFIAATNINDVVPNYLETGVYEPKKSQRTISNAMDVGRPSNMERIKYLFGDNLAEMRKKIWGRRVRDEQTTTTIRHVFKDTGYVLDPHTAVGYAAVKEYAAQHKHGSHPYIILGTAHPAKFRDIVEPLLNSSIKLPPQLEEALQKDKQSIKMGADYQSVREFLIKKYGK